MGLSTMAGVYWQAVVGVLVGIAAVVALARLLARRSGRSERTIVSFGSDR